MDRAPSEPVRRAMPRRVLVYCASSSQSDSTYREAAHRLGEILAEARIAIVYGGGSQGSMGALANGALSRGGEVFGVLPRFMADVEWGHDGLTSLELVEDMRERKQRMLDGSDAVVALPGGSGTFEELFEAISLKRLGLYLNPVILVNTNGFFGDFATLMQRCVEERFMTEQHRTIWQIVDTPEQVLASIASAPAWSSDARATAVL